MALASKFVTRAFSRIFAFLLFELGFCIVDAPAIAGWIEDQPDRTVVHLKSWLLPDPTRVDTLSRSEAAVVRQFVDDYPAIFAAKYQERYKKNLARYGRHNWDNVELRLHQFSGITIEGQAMDSQPLMAIAGGVSPDVIYVNFRQSDTYVQQGFLYPLDLPEDSYMSAMTQEELEYQINSRIWPVIRRRGPNGQTNVWAVPMGGIIGRVVLYRKDILDKHGIEYPANDWTWDDFLEICRKVTEPEKGIYGAYFGRGPTESWYWVSFLWSAGGEAMLYNEQTDQWTACFNTPGAAQALDFYTRLCAAPWLDANGRKRYGYAYKDPVDGPRKWTLGQIAFNFDYIQEKAFSTIDPEITGMVPVPLGPNGGRGAELNAGMQGIFSGVTDPVVRDAAWEFIRYRSSKDAFKVRTRVMVEGGLGRFVNPKYLREFGYSDIIRLAPKGWEECFRIAIDTGKPEPYGRNAQFVYDRMTTPIQKAESLMIAGKLPSDEPERLEVMARLLDQGVNETNEKMIGLIPPEIMAKRRWTAVGLLMVIALVFALVFQRVISAFAPPPIQGAENQGAWRFKKFFFAYLLLLPALAAILFWQYIPLLMGSKMAFQDYRIIGSSCWVGVDNFANLIWDTAWWSSVYNSIRYSLLVIAMTFLPPVVLAVFLQEIPAGRLIFRTIFYLPAVITGLVVIYLWKSFYEPTEFGVLNSVILKMPAAGFLALGAVFFVILFFFARRLAVHRIYWASILCLGVGIFIAAAFFRFTMPIFQIHDAAGLRVPWFRALFLTMPEPYRWLLAPETAMFCCVLPMIWSGMGPGCLIYLAALKGISDDFYEAADLDGATFIDKILFVVIPILKPLLIIQFIGVFISAWNSSAFILAMTGGASNTEVADLHIFYKAYLYLKFGPAGAMAWVLGFMLIGFTVYQLRILSKLEFKTTGSRA